MCIRDSLVENKQTCNDIADELLKDSEHKKVTKQELMTLLEHSDKDLFKDFRDHKISLAQLKARVYKRRFKVDYTCFDDIKHLMDPAWIDPKNRAQFAPTMRMIYGDKFKPEDVLRQLEPYEVNSHCLNSLRWHQVYGKKESTGATCKEESDFFKATSRGDILPADRHSTEIARQTRKLID